MQSERERSADRWSGIGWIIFGLVIIAHALTMETREYLGATFLTGPGLVPCMIGAAVAALGAVLLVRSRRGAAAPFFDEAEPRAGRRVAIALVLMLVYGLVLIGTLPFELATFLFVTAFIVVFNLPTPSRRGLVALLAKATVTGLLTAAAVTYVFETIFLVRLP